MKVAIVGAGAVGGVLGAMLSRAGHEVSFVAHGPSIDVLRSSGLTITSPTETWSTRPLRAEEDPAKLGPSELVIVCVKSWQVEEIAPKLQPLLGAETMVVPTQNGVEAAIQLAAALGEKNVIGGVCHVLATREAPGRVKYVGFAPSLTIGERKAPSGDRVAKLGAVLRESGLVINLPPDIESALWSKLLFVEPWGSIGAVSRSSAEILRSVPETRALLEQSMREVQAVASGRGVSVPDSAIAQSLARIDGMPAGAMASMHRDIIEGRASELNEQTGAVVRLGTQAKVPVPVHQFAYASLLPQTRR